MKRSRVQPLLPSKDVSGNIVAGILGVIAGLVVITACWALVQIAAGRV